MGGDQLFVPTIGVAVWCRPDTEYGTEALWRRYVARRHSGASERRTASGCPGAGDAIWHEEHNEAPIRAASPKSERISL